MIEYFYINSNWSLKYGIIHWRHCSGEKSICNTGAGHRGSTDLGQFREKLQESAPKSLSPEAESMAYLEKHPDTVIICDEVGNGIVPLDSFEREYRERLGRLLCEIAAKAERVERIVCGIGQRIK